MFRPKLEHKILLIIVAGLVCGLGFSVIVTIKRESDNLVEQYRMRSLLFGDTLMAGFRNVMLAGRAGYIEQLVADARAEFRDFGELLLFDDRGEEIFEERGRFVSQPAGEPRVAAALRERRAETFQQTRISPLLNDPACQRCHGEAEAVRGATWLSLADPTVDGEAPGPGLMASRILAAAFKEMMVSDQGGLADTLLLDAAHLPMVRFAQVYDNSGTFPMFGDAAGEIDPEHLEDAIAAFEADPMAPPRLVRQGDGQVVLAALPNEERCYVCHGGDHALRGLLAVSCDDEPESGAADPSRENALPLIQGAFATGFRSMMLVEAGTHAGDYVHAVRQEPFVSAARVFSERDAELVELYVPNPEPKTAPPSIVDSVLTMIRRVNQADLEDPVPDQLFVERLDGQPFLVQVKAIKNELRCQVCHAPPQVGSSNYAQSKDRWKVRTVMALATPMAGIQRRIDRNTGLSIAIGLATLFIVWIILRFFMHRYVVRPIAAIGGTASEIGGGNLRVRAQVDSRDELGELAEQINDMANGLRERSELTKFVSTETLDAVRLSHEGVKLGGERRVRTLFFSDIRGFTAYSERVEPEQVISMLNTYLRAQSDMVNSFGGDVDKFVADEVVATFDDEGELPDNMVVRAVRCAYAIQERVRELNRDYPDADIGVGIGINTGPVVLGAMGSEARMDYTVLGDAVNVASRLCSAAQAGQIIVSAEAREHVEGRSDIALRPLPPLSVKNKSEPLTVYQVERADLP